MVGLPEITIAGWNGALGAEPTPEAYIGHLLLVERECWRVLRDDGISFVNLGDSYSTNPGNGRGGESNIDGAAPHRSGADKTRAGIPPKNMLMIPHRFALAAQSDGWIVRSDMCWLKRNCLPESANDRPTKATEHIFMLVKSDRYYWDMDAVKQPVADASIGRAGRKQRLIDETGLGAKDSKQINDGVDNTHGYAGLALGRNGNTGYDIEGGRFFRNSDFFFKTWQGMVTNEEGDPLAMVINPLGYKGAHFATFPLELPLTLIKAATSAYGVCPKCAAPYVRMVERKSMVIAKTSRNEERGTRTGTSGTMLEPAKSQTVGWEPSCSCDAGKPVPATVLDQFNGSGTTGRASLQLNRDYIGVDISTQYLEDLSPKRLENVQIQMEMA